MNSKAIFKLNWLAVILSSTVLLTLDWLGADWRYLEHLVIALNSLALAFSLPCGLFVVPVLVAADHYLALNPFSGDGLYLATILLLVVGAMQWFWIERFWSPTEPALQRLELSDRQERSF